MANPLTRILGHRRLLLASASPRRRQLLSALWPEVETVTLHNVDETYPVNLAPEKVASFLSRKKAESYLRELSQDDILITADTVVVNRGMVVGKPSSPAEATRMLAQLSGHTHKVITGVTIATATRMDTFDVSTEVDFEELSADEIGFYVDEFKPFDKAGSYGIQEWIGYIGIKAIRGDFYNVMGLPVNALYSRLKALLAPTASRYTPLF